MKRKTGNAKEKGQATILVLVALGLFLLVGIGFTLDLSGMYAQRQMAQNAADAAALAAMMSIFNATNTGTNTFGNIPGGGGNPARLSCASNDNHTPCYYARQNGFDPSSGDTVYVDFWARSAAFTQEPGVSISAAAQDTVPLLRVTVMRSVPATLMSLVGGGTNKVAAQATAAITTTISPIPIIILHPTLSGALNLSGTGSTNKIKICGGPRRSIQVNSCAGTGGSIAKPNGTGSASCASGGSFTWNGNPTIDLSHAGPLDTGGCTNGTGADFGNFGLPLTVSGTVPVSFGTVGKYVAPAAVIADPLLNIPQPTTAGLTNQDALACTPGAHTTCHDIKGNAVFCPTTDAFGACVSGCTILNPGIYTSAGPLNNLKNDFYVFTPGVYYIQSGGLAFKSNSSAQTQTVPPSGPAPYPTCANADANTGCGVLFFLAADGTNANTLSISANASDIAILGSDPTLTYQRIAIFVDRTAIAQTHSFGGGGTWNVTGTLYMTNTIARTLNSTGQSQYQTLNLGGNSGSGTVTGEIIADVLGLNGSPGITMNLDPGTQPIRQIALVR